MRTLKKKWHWIIFWTLFVIQACVFFIFREQIYVGICDNLDLFITQLKMLQDRHAYFTDTQMAVLKDLNRNFFPTEFSVYNLLYFIFPDLYAYIIGLLLKILLSMFSCILLAKELLGSSKYRRYERQIVLTATAFSCLPLYPMYSFCFASIPLIIWLLIKVYKGSNQIYYVGVFLYPLLSYFSFFGAFILGYLIFSIVVLAIRDRKVSLRLVLAFLILAAGYVCFEHRLFYIMFFMEEETIRSTMAINNMSGLELWKCFVDVFVHGIDHAESVHTLVVLPCCIVYFIIDNITHLKKRDWVGIITDPFNLILLFIAFNSAVYALYYWEPLRNLVALVLPPLMGFQYGRTAFFNPFLWYMAFFIVLCKLQDRQMWVRRASYFLGLFAILVVIGTQTGYNDFYNTCYCNLYRIVKGKEPNQLSYGEFYGKELFHMALEDMEYQTSQGVCAYGFHPAQLAYNGFATIDGYCGYYTQEYKEAFRQGIAPVLEKVPKWKKYYDEWGCRAYLFSPTGENLYDYGANAVSVPQEIMIDEQALKGLGCDYIFSRFEISNAQEQGLEFYNMYSSESVPYPLYVYELR